MKLILIAVLIFFNSNRLFALEFSGPISGGMGGAGIGAFGDPENLFLNPASAVTLTDFHMAYYYRQEAIELGQSNRDWSLQLVDANEDLLFPGGFSYISRTLERSGGATSVDDYKVSFGWRPMEAMSLGFNLDYWVYSGPFPKETVFQFGIGAQAILAEGLTLGFVSQNIRDDHRAGLLIPKFGLGVEYGYEDLLRFRLDGEYLTKFNPNKKANLKVGMESRFFTGVCFRAGGRWDEVARVTYGTLGLGWRGPRLSLDYSYEKDIRSADHFFQTFDLRFFF